MNESDLRAIALFFYFAFLDDKKAIEASTHAISFCQERLKRNPELRHNVAVVAATQAVWDRYKVKLLRGRPNTTVESGWLIPSGVDLGPWREFQKNSASDELLTVIWSKVLKFSDQDISEGLGITQGTIRYRLGRALRKIGSVTQAVKQKYV